MKEKEKSRFTQGERAYLLNIFQKEEPCLMATLFEKGEKDGTDPVEAFLAMKSKQKSWSLT